ncbi:fasciclin domain-containing protein [Akkermansiaceae bacterium]|nr:fasciclin domain-containing protein [Akkermansiaceae bacterium]
MKKTIMAFGLALTTLTFSAQTTVVDVIVNSEDHTLLEAAVVQAGLVEALSDTTATFTVFAPTDSAFITLATSLQLEPTDLLELQNLADILTYHVVGATALSTDLYDGMEVTALNNNTLTIGVDSMGVTVEYAMVTIADIVTDNGVVHVIDAVLVPSSTNSILELENKTPQNNIYYNIMGQEINSYDQIPFNSIYIKNGKKFLKIEG